jgi:hypothetical protein
MKKIAMTIALSLTFPLSVCAHEMTAGELLDLCNSSNQMVRRTCSRYILGVVQGVDLASGASGVQNPFCVPGGVTEDRMMLVFLNAANVLRISYPKDMDLSAVGVVFGAMVKAFPCAKSRQ